MTTLLRLVVAGMLLGMGLAVQFWSSSPRRSGQQYALQLPSILMYALAGSVLLYSTFPDSLAEGKAFGFSLGGAAAMFGLIMVASLTWLTKARAPDKRISDLDVVNKQLKKELTKARAELAIERAVEQPPRQLLRTLYCAAAVRGAGKHQIGIVTGDIKNITGIDVWVNAENTRMEMARIVEATISGTIRRLGGKRIGNQIEDTIADELREQSRNRTPVEPAEVIATGPGALATSHGVKRILHVASVDAPPGAGFRQVANIGDCVHNVLQEMDQLNAAGEKLSTVVIPLLGTGNGKGELPSTVEAMVSAAINYFAGHRGSAVRTVYLLAYTDVQEIVLRTMLEQETDLGPLPQGTAR